MPPIDVDALARQVAERLSALLAPQVPLEGRAVPRGTAACSCGCGRQKAQQPAAASMSRAACACGGAKQAGPAGGDAHCGCGGPKRLVLHERVVSVGTLAGRLGGVEEVHVPPRAIVTPAAADVLREAGVVLVRGEQAAPGPGCAPLVVAAAETRGAERGLLAALAADDMAVEQLARVGLREAVMEWADHAVRGGRRCLLFTTRPHVGACLANRHRGVRAVVAERAADPHRALAEAAANVLVLDPAGWPAFALRRLVRAFVLAERPPCPAELQYEEA